MRVWLVHAGEVLPVDHQGERKLRMSLLAETLSQRGHEVLWWTSTFDHPYKRHRHDRDRRLTLPGGYDLYMLKGTGYARNVSLGRIVDHVQLGRRFGALAASLPTPDLVVATLPTIELANRTVRYARERGIPAVVDVNDLWPDIFLDVLPSLARPFARWTLAPWFRAVRRALEAATGVTAVSPEYLAWGLARAGRPHGTCDGVFPLGYPRLDFAPEAMAAAEERLVAMGVEPAKFIVWSIGMLGHTYDLSTAIESARYLEGQGVPIQLVISGAGDHEKRWRKEAADLANVAFTGWVKAAEIAWLLSHAKVGLAAYRRGAPQTHPNKYFEYMHGGLPILSSLTGSGAELLQRHECGLTYRAGDSHDLAAALQRLATDEPMRVRLAANSRRAFVESYAADAVYGAMADHLENVVLYASGRTG